MLNLNWLELSKFEIIIQVGQRSFDKRQSGRRTGSGLRTRKPIFGQQRQKHKTKFDPEKSIQSRLELEFLKNKFV